MSWVFLAGDFAYKLKKPVRYDYLDFSTPALRRHFCEEELRLNRRLAPSVYIDVVPLTQSPAGKLQIGGPHRPVDWLVKMRRLPRERMLDSALRNHRVTAPDLTGIASLLAGFYARAQKSDMHPVDYRMRFQIYVEEFARELIRYGSGLPPAMIASITDSQRAYLESRGRTLERRAEEQRIVEAHGDLRPEHVYLGPPPEIIDCLEFRRDFRVVDCADELASLAMECERLGAPEAGRVLFDAYERATGDHPPEDLIRFYKSIRACTRAKLAIWHLRDEHVANPAKWRDQARSYCEMAVSWRLEV